jgi:hypothetical protein
LLLAGTVPLVVVVDDVVCGLGVGGVSVTGVWGATASCAHPTASAETAMIAPNPTTCPIAPAFMASSPFVVGGDRV